MVAPIKFSVPDNGLLAKTCIAIKFVWAIGILFTLLTNKLQPIFNIQAKPSYTQLVIKVKVSL